MKKGETMKETQLQQYDDWVADHLNELVEQYAGKVVAIYKGEVILIGNSEADVYSQVSQKGIEPAPLVFRIPREEDFQSIL